MPHSAAVIAHKAVLGHIGAQSRAGTELALGAWWTGCSERNPTGTSSYREPLGGDFMKITRIACVLSASFLTGGVTGCLVDDTRAVPIPEPQGQPIFEGTGGSSAPAGFDAGFFDAGTYTDPLVVPPPPPP